MTKYSLFASGAKIELDASEGGALAEIQSYVTDITGFDREGVTEEITPVGAGNEAHGYIGLDRCAEITLSGPYDSAFESAVATPGIGETRSFKITWASGVTSAVETIIKNYRRIGQRGAFTRFEMVLQPTGDVTEV